MGFQSLSLQMQHGNVVTRAFHCCAKWHPLQPLRQCIGFISLTPTVAIQVQV